MAKKKTTRHRSPKKEPTQNVAKQKSVLINRFRGLLDNASLLRGSILTKLFDERRDIDVECGYPKDISTEQYRTLYDREGVANRVVSVIPQDSWAMDPMIFETEDQSETAFEKAWTELQDKHNLYHFLHRIDELSGIGRFGILLLGLSDGKPLSEPVAELDSEGNLKGTAGKLKLLYLRAFDESAVTIKTREIDIHSPRYGLPVLYKVTFQESVGVLSSTEIAGVSGDTSAATTTTRDLEVHWSRVIHVADNRSMSEVYGTPRMQPVYNRIYDLRKIVGGSGEMFWKGAFPGYAFEMSPEAVQSGAEIDSTAFRAEMEDFQNGLQRFIALTGISTKSLAPQVADPSSHVEVNLRYIAITLGVPYRIFLGTEEAKLASAQDVRTWNKRLAKRQEKYLTPMVIRPFIDRLIALDILPVPPLGYQVVWLDLNTPTDMDKAEVSDKRTQALAKYVAGNVDALIPPAEFLDMIMGMEVDEVEAILKAAGEREVELKSEEDELAEAATDLLQKEREERARQKLVDEGIEEEEE